MWDGPIGIDVTDHVDLSGGAMGQTIGTRLVRLSTLYICTYTHTHTHTDTHRHTQTDTHRHTHTQTHTDTHTHMITIILHLNQIQIMAHNLI